MVRPRPTPDEIYRRRVSRVIFQATPSAVGSSPRAVLVGGQPGSGKSQILFRAREELGAQVAAIVNGDDLRVFHPDFHELLGRDELSIAERTSPLTGRWVEMAIAEAIQRRVPVVIEGTFRRSGTTTDTAGRLKDAGYFVSVRAVALHEWWSRLAIVNRYLDMRSAMGWGRWTPRAAHDEAYANMIETVRACEADDAVDEVVVLRRDGTVLYHSHGSASEGIFGDAVTAVGYERRRTWSETEFVAFVDNVRVCEHMLLDDHVPALVRRELDDLVEEVRAALGR